MLLEPSLPQICHRLDLKSWARLYTRDHCVVFATLIPQTFELPEGSETLSPGLLLESLSYGAGKVHLHHRLLRHHSPLSRLIKGIAFKAAATAPLHRCTRQCLRLKEK